MEITKLYVNTIKIISVYVISRTLFLGTHVSKEHQDNVEHVTISTIFFFHDSDVLITTVSCRRIHPQDFPETGQDDGGDI